MDCETNAAEQVLMPLLPRFMELYPALHFQIRSEGRLVDIAQGGFDCGVLAAEWFPVIQAHLRERDVKIAYPPTEGPFGPYVVLRHGARRPARLRPRR